MQRGGRRGKVRRREGKDARLGEGEQVDQVPPPLRLSEQAMRASLDKLPIRLIQHERNLLLHRQVRKIPQQLVRINRAGRVIRRHEDNSLDGPLVSGDELGAVGDGGEERVGSGANEREDGDS